MTAVAVETAKARITIHYTPPAMYSFDIDFLGIDLWSDNYPNEGGVAVIMGNSVFPNIKNAYEAATKVVELFGLKLDDEDKVLLVDNENITQDKPEEYYVDTVNFKKITLQ